MGQVIGQAAGTAIGGAFGGPFGAALGGAVGGLIGGYIGGGGKDQVREGPRLANLRVATSKYGEEILTIRGRFRPACKVIWGPPIVEVVNESKESGGKGGGPEVTTRTFVYFASWAGLICQGEMGDPLRVWFDARLMYDVRESASPVTRANSFAWADRYMTYYPGSETQGPDPTIVAVQGVGKVNANKGLAYAVFKDYPLSDFGNRRPSVSIEIASKTAESRFIAVAEDGGMGKVYLLTDMSVEADLINGPTGGTYHCRFNYSKSRHVQAGAGGNRLGIYDTADWTIAAVPSPIPSASPAAAGEFSHDDSLYIAGLEASPWWARYETANWTELSYITQTKKVTGIAFSPDDSQVAIGTTGDSFNEPELKIYNTDTWAELGIFGPQLPTPNWYGVRDLAWSPDGKWLVVALEWTRPLLVYDTTTWTLLPDPPGGVLNQGANEIRFSPDGKYLAFGYSQTPYIAIWQTAPNTSNWVRLPNVSPAPDRFGNGVAWNAAGTEVALSSGTGGQGSINRWTVPGLVQQPVPTFKPAIRSGSCDYDIGFVTADQIPRAEMIAQVCEESGLAPDMYDTSLISELETGFFYGLQSGRSKLENLAIAGFFNGVESQGAIRFRPRGVFSGVTIDVEELVTSADGSEDGPALVITPGDEIEVPQLLSISFPQSTKGYEQGEAHQQRQVTASLKKEQIDIRVVMDPTRATKVVDTALYQMWSEKKLFRFALTMKYYFLDAGDVIEIEDTEAENSWFIRLTSIVMDGYVLLQCEGVEENLGLYESNAAGAGGPPEDDEVAGLGDTTAVLLDVPMLVDAQNGPRITFALAGIDEGWVGGVLQRSNDGGTSYQTVAQSAINSTLGITDTLLADGIHHTWDTENTVDVTLDNPEKDLESRDELAVLNGSNTAAIGDDGRWEIVQYVNATLIGSNQYRLSKLLRGQKGTEHNRANHTASDRFVFLSPNLIGSAGTSLSALNRARLFKGVSVGQDPVTVTGFPFTYRGVNLKPYAPVQAKGVRDGSNNLTVTFFRRSRFSSAMLKTPILGETVEAYQFDILNPGVVNTYATAITTFVYSAAEQTADGITPGDPVTMRIFQMSEAVGRGYPLEVTL